MNPSTNPRKEKLVCEYCSNAVPRYRLEQHINVCSVQCEVCKVRVAKLTQDEHFFSNEHQEQVAKSTEKLH